MLNQSCSTNVVITQLPSALSGAQRRCAFAVWPQVLAHPSWLAELEREIRGQVVNREVGIDADGRARALARALLARVGAMRTDRVTDAWLPRWALDSHATMQRHLSTVAASLLAVSLRRLVSPAAARAADEVLGNGVRRAALLLSVRQGALPTDAHADGLLLEARAALADADEWQRFCLGLALALLHDAPAGVAARVRLAWPQSLANVQPLPMAAALRQTLQVLCEQGSHVQPPKPQHGASAASVPEVPA